MTTLEPAGQAVISRLTREWPDLWAIYLFGSRGRGGAGPASDIDLAILGPGPLPPVRLWDVAQDLASLARADADLVDLRKASTVLQAQVVSTGRRIYCSNERECDSFETYVLSSYARLNEERRDILRGILDRGSFRGG
ncbi:MAG: nucleotidyltransferase domain-containing protein [Candidatus Sericytochromatia bacterium]|nr:nucleotidyltransferase domain-containing protein [Candidatus Tanganyikabacteria bacterium]